MATISFTTKFDLSVSPKIFVFEDTADYVGQGIALVNVNGCFNITSPSGIVIYNNTDFSNGGCDIRNSVDRINQTSIQLPLGTDGYPEAGTYTILYTVYDNNLLVYSTVTNTYTYDYTSPTVTISQTVDCVSPLFTSTDTTDYDFDGITPTITRNHDVNFPVGSGLAPETTASATATFGSGEFANGTQTTEITTILEYTFDDGLVVRDSVTAVQEILVDCTYICAIYCCIRSLEQQMLTAQTTNTVRYNELKALFSQVMGLVGLAKLAIECGKSTDVSGYMDLIKTLANCTDDCSCTGDEPTLVVGIGGLINQVVVDSGDATVVVTPVTVGNTTTYTVTLNTTFVNTVNSLYNTAISAGYGVSLSSVTAGLLTTYTASVSLVTTRAESAVVFAVPIASNTTVTGCTVTAPTTGTYLVLVDADFKAPGGAGDCTYRLYKNGTTVVSNDRRVILPGGDESKMSYSTSLSLTATDTLVIQVDSTSGGTIEGRSITILRTA